MATFDLSTNLTSVYSYRMHEYQLDVSDLQSRISDDYDLISQYKNQENDSRGVLYAFREEVQEKLKEIEQTKQELEDELAAFSGIFDLSGWGSGKTAEQLFNEIFEPLLQAVEPLMNVVGMLGLPEIPIIGNIQSIIEKIAKTGRLISKLPAEALEAARQEEEYHKELEKAANEKQRKAIQEEKNMSDWQRFKDDFANSEFGKICIEIVQIFKEVINVLIMMCQCSVYMAILMLLDKLKPVIEMFKLVVGDIITIISSAATVMKMLMTSSAQMLRFFYRTLEEKLSQLWGVIQYITHGGNLPVNFLISAAYADIVCCEIEIDRLKINMNQISAEHVVDLNQEEIDKWKLEADKCNGELKTLQEAAPPNSKRIRDKKMDVSFAKASELMAEQKKKETEEIIAGLSVQLETFDKDASTRWKNDLDKKIGNDLDLLERHKAMEEQNAANLKLSAESEERIQRAISERAAAEARRKEYEAQHAANVAREAELRVKWNDKTITDEEVSEFKTVCGELNYIVQADSVAEAESFVESHHFFPSNLDPSLKSTEWYERQKNIIASYH